MLKAVEEGVPADEHILRSLAALTEAHTELEARVTRIETGPEWTEPLRKPQDS